MTRLLWIVCAFPFVVSAQEEKKGDPAAAREEAGKALRATVGAGTVAFSGTATGETDLDDSEDEPEVIKLSGTAGTPFKAVLRARAGKCSHEIFEKDGKTAGRSTWRGKPMELGRLPDEVLSMLDLGKLAAAAVQAPKGSPGREEKVGEAECRTVLLTLGPEAVRTHLRGEDADDENEEGPVDHVELKLWIAKVGGLVLKLEADIQRHYKNEDDPTDERKTHSTCALIFSEHGAAKVSIPARIERQLEE